MDEIIFGIIALLLGLLMLTVIIIGNFSKSDELCNSIGYDKFSNGGVFGEDYCLNSTDSQKVRLSCGITKCNIYPIK